MTLTEAGLVAITLTLIGNGLTMLVIAEYLKDIRNELKERNKKHE